MNNNRVDASSWLDWGQSHPSWSIVSSSDNTLEGSCIVLGVTGSVAIYKSVDVARQLMRWGASIRVVMTRAATELVSPTLFEWATGLPVVTKLTGAVEHVSLARRCRALLIAPATMDTLADIASLHASDPVSALAQEMIGLGKPVLAVPVMHLGMWRRTRRIVERLARDGVAFMEPRVEGEQAKYPDPYLVAWWTESRILRGGDLDGLSVLVTAGPTRKRIDDVRVVTNPSSGLMGVSIALEAAWRSARVVLVHGPLSCCNWSGWKNYLAKTASVESTEEMLERVLEEVKEVDMAFYAAAPADYKPEKREEGKIPSIAGSISLVLVPTKKIVEYAVKTNPNALHVGFTAEPLTGEKLVARALEKLERYNLDLIAANSTVETGSGFAHETNHIYIVSRDGVLREVKAHKRVVARLLLDIAMQRHRDR